jgi:hypothetical protein
VKEKRKISDSDTNEIQSEKKKKVESKSALKNVPMYLLFSFCIVMFKNVSYVYRFVFLYYLNFMLNCLL